MIYISLFRLEMGTRSRGQEQTWTKSGQMSAVDFPKSVTYTALQQNYKKKSKPVHNKSGSITTVYLCNYARKVGYACKRQMRTVEVNDIISIEWNEKECDHKLNTTQRETTDYSKADNVIEECVKLGVKSRPIKRKLNQEKLLDVRVTAKKFYAKVYREKKKLKQTQTKMDLAEFKEFMEEYSVANGVTDVVIKCHDIREDESNLVVKFITTNEYLWNKYIVNMEDDVTLALDATYNTNVENFCVWLFGILLKNSSFQPVGEMVSSNETAADVKYLLQAIKDSSKKDPKYVMADGAQSISKAVHSG